LTEAVAGLVEACEALGIPIVGGNVSLYNEAPSGPIFPTPVVGIVWKLPDPARAAGLGFSREGDAIALVGPFEPSLDASEVEKLRGRAPVGELPAADSSSVLEAQVAVREAVRAGTLRSAHDIAEGGIAVALAECCIAGGIGAAVSLPDGLDPFAEAPGRGYIVSGPEREIAALGTVIGRVGGAELAVAEQLELPVSGLAREWSRGLAELV
jgi:phosphoribosylformylglycinamidine synthase